MEAAWRHLEASWVLVELSANIEEIITQRGKNGTCGNERAEVNVAACQRRLGGGLEVAWMHQETSCRPHEETKSHVMVSTGHRLGDICECTQWSFRRSLHN